MAASLNSFLNSSCRRGGLAKLHSLCFLGWCCVIDAASHKEVALFTMSFSLRRTNRLPMNKDKHQESAAAEALHNLKAGDGKLVKIKLQ
jgi:hypothetical protein